MFIQIAIGTALMLVTILISGLAFWALGFWTCRCWLH